MVKVRGRKKSELKQPEGEMEDFSVGSYDLGLRSKNKYIVDAHTLMMI